MTWTWKSNDLNMKEYIKIVIDKCIDDFIIPDTTTERVTTGNGSTEIHLSSINQDHAYCVSSHNDYLH